MSYEEFVSEAFAEVLPKVDLLKSFDDDLLTQATKLREGSFIHSELESRAVVNDDGEICSVADYIDCRT